MKKSEHEDTSKNLGVLYTGYVEKQNPRTGVYNHKRFLVLTRDSIHWFNRPEGHDLFGEERGNIPLADILSVRILDEDSTIFEIKDAARNVAKHFRCNTPNETEEWVSGIRSAIKRISGSDLKAKKGNRRGSIANILLYDDNETDIDESQTKVEVDVLLVSLRSFGNLSISLSGKSNRFRNSITSSMSGTLLGKEVVLARNPKWNRVILVPNVKQGDEVVISTSNGGNVVLSSDMLEDKVDISAEGFEVALQNVPLASSLKISVLRASSYVENDNDMLESNKNWFARMKQLCLKLSIDRRNTATLVLATTFLMVSISSFASVNEDTSFMFILAILLAAHSLHLIISSVRGKNNTSEHIIPKTYRIILRGHAFTSPDAPVNEPEEVIPQRFIIGCNYDMKEARRRWDITKHWRETEGVNVVLQKEQPYFFAIKEFYPHYHAGHGKEGHIVFYDRPGELDTAQFAARGIKVKDLVDHFIFISEYQWQILCGGDELAKSIAVLDIGSVKMSDLSGDPLEYTKKTVSIANAHYPERSFVIFVVNAPIWFSVLWNLIKPLVHENTQKKIRILSRSQTLKGLQEHIDISQIPTYYGGQLSFGPGNDSCRFNSPEQIAMNEFVSKINNKQAPAINRGSVPTDTSADSSKSSDQTNVESPRSARSNRPAPLNTGSSVRLSLVSSSDASTSLSSSISEPPKSNRNTPSTLVLNCGTSIKNPLSIKQPPLVNNARNENSIPSEDIRRRH